MARLSRPERAKLDRLVGKLRKLPLLERAAVIRRLPAWQQEILERRL
jgi:hypothetical protein